MSRESLKNLRPEDVQRLEVLSKIGKRINTPERFSEALKAVLDSVVESLEAERGALFLALEETDYPQLALFLDTTEENDKTGFRYSSTVVEKVWTELQPLAEVDTLDNEDLASKASIQAEGIRSVICVPLLGREAKLGLLYLDTRLSNAFTLADLQMLDVIADLASTALERARFFDALQSLNDELEGRVVQRTAEAEAARVEAERATKAKSLFLAKMSHELRTPLNGVLGLTEDLAQREKNPALRLQLNQVIESARSLSSLINGVLDFSKLESEQVVLDLHDFNLEEAVVTSLASVNYEASKKGLEVQVWIDGSVPLEVEGDSTRLKQILTNLLSNAVKFTAKGYVRLIVTAPQTGIVRLRVADSGVGIPADKQMDIFKPFSQADVSTTREFGGTGLGLSICQSLCKLLGARMELESQLGEGSQFTIELPLKFLKEFEKPDYGGLPIALSLSSVAQRQALERALGSWGCIMVSEVSQAKIVIVSTGQVSPSIPSLVLLDPGQVVDTPLDTGIPQRHVLTPVTRSLLKSALDELLHPEQTEPIAPSAANPESLSPPPNSTILVVEDHEINRLVIKKMLETWGYQCLLADSGLEAVESAQKLQPRIILMDIEMPGQDGFTTARQIRSYFAGLSQEAPPVPILAVTAHLATDLRERCLAAGMDDLLGKPISRQAFASRLKRWESFLAGELTRSQVRHKDFPELSNWPARFLSPINSKLSTLAILAENESNDSVQEALEDLETLSFSAGLLHWGGRCVALPRPIISAQLKELIADFQQEWRALAPSLLP